MAPAGHNKPGRGHGKEWPWPNRPTYRWPDWPELPEIHEDHPNIENPLVFSSISQAYFGVLFLSLILKTFCVSSVINKKCHILGLPEGFSIRSEFLM